MATTPDYVAIPNTDIDADSPITVALMTSLRDNARNAAPVGCEIEFNGPATEIPVGWMEADGTAISRTTYGDLFTVIGTTWGTGDGSTTFNLPDSRSRSTIGVGQGSGLTLRNLADTGGEETHSLTSGEGPSHTHNISYGGIGSGSPIINIGGTTLGNSFSAQTASSGSGTGHNTMHPFIAKRKIIRVQ